MRSFFFELPHQPNHQNVNKRKKLKKISFRFRIVQIASNNVGGGGAGEGVKMKPLLKIAI